MIYSTRKKCAMRSLINSYHDRITANTPAKVRQSYREQQVEHFINYSPIGNTMIGKWLKKRISLPLQNLHHHQVQRLPGGSSVVPG